MTPADIGEADDERVIPRRAVHIPEGTAGGGRFVAGSSEEVRWIIECIAAGE